MEITLGILIGTSVGGIAGMLVGFFFAVKLLRTSLQPVVEAGMAVIKDANNRMAAEVEQAATITTAIGPKSKRTMWDRK